MSDDNKKSSTLALSGILSAIISAVVAGGITLYVKDREVSVEFVKLAVAILRVAPSGADSQLRDWANDVMETYSEVPWTDEIRREVDEEAGLPKTRPDAYIILDRIADRNDAEATAKQYLDLGFPAAVYRRHNNLFVVALGPYSNPNDASRTQESISAQHGSELAEIEFWTRVPYVVFPRQ